MSLLQDHLFATLRAALWQTPLQLTLTPEEAKDLLDEARQQTVDGLVCGALIDNNIALPKVEIARCLDTLQRTAEANAHINTEISRFAPYMERKGFALAIVKGQSVGTCYPHPERRQSGDVDFFVRSDCFEPMRQLVEKQIGMPVKDHGGKHVNFEGEGVDYEMHRRLVDFCVARHQRYYDALCEEDMRGPLKYVTLCGAQVPTLPATGNALFVFLHMFWHFIQGGVGLRQLLDNAMLLHAWHAEIDAEALRRHLKGVGMEQAYRAFGHIYIQYLGLPATDFPYTLTRRDARRGERIFRDVLRFGNFGRKMDGRYAWGSKAHTAHTASIVLRQSVKYHALARAELTAAFPVLTLYKFRGQNGVPTDIFRRHKSKP